MLSTSLQAPLTISLRRGETTAFWLMIALIVSVSTGVALTMARASAGWAAAAGICVLIPGAVWPLWFELGIRAWNKGVRLLTSALRRYTLIVCYYVLFGAVSRVGSSLDIVRERSQSSKWRSRTHYNAARHGRATPDRGQWLGGLLAAIRSPGHGWVGCLAPFMLLLMVLHDEQQETAPPSSTYTLY